MTFLTKSEKTKLLTLLANQENAQYYKGLIENNLPKIHEKILTAKDIYYVPYAGALHIGLNKENTCTNAKCNNKTKYISFSKGFKEFCSSYCKETNTKISGRPKISPIDSNHILNKSIEFVDSPTKLFPWMKINHPEVHAFCLLNSKTNCTKYSKELYDLINGKHTGCKKCGNPVAFISLNCGYKNYCSNYCQGSCSLVQEKKKNTNIEARGVEFPQQCPKVKAKLVKNNLVKYGVSNVSGLKSVKKTRAATMVERYGSTNAMGNEELRYKASSRSGKSRGAFKEFKLGRRTVSVMGFEPQALNWILSNTNVTPSMLKVDTERLVPYFEYAFDRQTRHYYPDFYIPKLNKIIEVKAKYPILSPTSRQSWYVLRAKRQAVIDAGFDFELLVMREDGSRIELPENWYDLGQASVIKLLRKGR